MYTVIGLKIHEKKSIGDKYIIFKLNGEASYFNSRDILCVFKWNET